MDLQLTLPCADDCIAFWSGSVRSLSMAWYRHHIPPTVRRLTVTATTVMNDHLARLLDRSTSKPLEALTINGTLNRTEFLSRLDQLRELSLKCVRVHPCDRFPTLRCRHLVRLDLAIRTHNLTSAAEVLEGLGNGVRDMKDLQSFYLLIQWQPMLGQDRASPNRCDVHRRVCITTADKQDAWMHLGRGTERVFMGGNPLSPTGSVSKLGNDCSVGASIGVSTCHHIART